MDISEKYRVHFFKVLEHFLKSKTKKKKKKKKRIKLPETQKPNKTTEDSHFLS